VINDIDLKEDVQCGIYCILKNNTTASISDEQFGQITDWLKGGNHGNFNFDNTMWYLGEFLNHVNRNQWRQLFNAYAGDSSSVCESLCADCPDAPTTWEQSFFPASDSLWYFDTNGGQEIGSNWMSVCQPMPWDNNNNRLWLFMNAPLPGGHGSTYGLTEMEIVTQSTSNAPTTWLHYWSPNYTEEPHGSWSVGENVVNTWSLANIPSPATDIGIHAIGDTQGQSGCADPMGIKISQITIRGTGTNPFGS
jgi:hypothetical protein